MELPRAVLEDDVTSDAIGDVTDASDQSDDEDDTKVVDIDNESSRFRTSIGPTLYRPRIHIMFIATFQETGIVNNVVGQPCRMQEPR